MHVQINQPRRNHFSARVEFPGLRGRGKIFAHGGDFAANEEHVGNGIEMVGGIHDATAGEKQRIHRVEFNARASAAQARQNWIM